MVSRRKNYFFYIIIVLIAISFIATGLGGISLKNHNLIATVGDKEITRSEFQKNRAIEYNQLRHMLGGEVPEFYQKQLETIILNKMIVQKMLENFIRDTGLTISDNEISKAIRTDENFYDSNKRFNKDIFFKSLEQNNLTERQYVEILKNHKLKDLLINHVVELPVIDEKIQQKLSTKINEQLHCDFYTLENNKKDFAISQKEIEQYYTQFKKSFYEDEKRSFVVSEITPENANKAVITDSEIDNYYQDNKEDFISSSSRDILNVVFTNQKDAQKFYNELVKAKGEYEKTLNNTKNTINNSNNYIMKEVHQEALIGELSAKVFAAPLENVLEPINSPLGWHVIKTIKINEPKLQSLQDVKKLIYTQLANEKTEKLYFDLVNEIDDSVSAGTDFDSIAKKFNLNIIKKTNQLRGTKTNIDSDLVDKIFTYQLDDKVQIINHDERNFLIEVTDIIPSQVKKIDLVSDEIKQEIILKKQNINMKEKVNEISTLIKQDNSLETLKTILNKYNDISYTANRGVKFTRINLPPQKEYDLSTKFLLSTFLLCKNCLSTPEIIDNNKFVIVVPTNTTEVKDKSMMYTEDKMKDIIYNSFLNHLQKTYQVKIHQEM